MSLPKASNIKADTTRKNHKEDDFEHGDLGLGNGLKPGSLTSGDAHVAQHEKPVVRFHRQPSLAPSCTESVSSLSSENSDSEEFSIIERGENEQGSGTLSRFFSRKSGGKSMDAGGSDEKFPTYADVPYGTSLKQQRRLFEHDLDMILNKNMPRAEVCTEEGCHLCSLSSPESHLRKAAIAEEIEHRLYKAHCEINELRIELENCGSRLQSKYHAIDILRRQAESCEEEYEQGEQRATDYSHELEKPLQLEINNLQFSLHHQEGMLETSQEVWIERFDRFCQENVLLSSKLKERTEELSRESMQNIGLKRERDELLALVDLQEKSRYERSRSSSSDDKYSDYTSSELAVLGACKCRGPGPDPCGCAHAAVKLKKDVNHLLDQVHKEKLRQQDLEQTVEAYRVAFDEQVVRNKELVLKVAEVGAPINRRIDKTKHILKWMMRAMQDQEKFLLPYDPLNGLLIADIDTTKFTDRQLLLLVIDMMNERTELRAHQKLASSIIKKSLGSDDTASKMHKSTALH